MRTFEISGLKKLYKPSPDSNGEENGQITIIGGSELFHGAPIMALKTASRFVDMVFFSSPEKSVGSIAEKIKSQLSTFIWVPWEEVDDYVEKSDAILIGNGFMRFRSENTATKDRIEKCDSACQESREITHRLLNKFPHKKWVIDAGSLQVIDPEWIPQGSILTPNKHEFETLFKLENKVPQQVHFSHEVKSVRDDKTGLESLPVLSKVQKYAQKYKCTIALKGVQTIVSNGETTVVVEGGNPGLTKGGTGDVQAGLTVALFAKNDAFLSACSASYIVKKSADDLVERVGVNYNAEDLILQIPESLNRLLN